MIYLPEGENPKILTALNTVIPEKIMEPVLLGEASVIEKHIKDLKLLNLKDLKILQPQKATSFSKYAEAFYNLKKTKGIGLKEAEKLLSQPNYFAAMAVHLGDGDALVTGSTDSFVNSVRPSLRIIGSGERQTVAGVNMVLLKNKVLFFADTAFNIKPTAEQVAHIAIYTAQMARYFTIEPRIALLSFVNFSNSQAESPQKMKEAVRLVKKWKPDLKIEGEVQADIAVNEDIAKEIFPKFSYDKGANILIFPNLDSGNIAYKLVQQLGSGEVLGPLLMGIKKPINVLQRTCTVEDIINTLILTTLKVYGYEIKKS